MRKGIGGLIARYLNTPVRGYYAPGLVPIEALVEWLQPCDVILVEGDRRMIALGSGDPTIVKPRLAQGFDLARPEWAASVQGRT